jgi:hypothetical protein
MLTQDIRALAARLRSAGPATMSTPSFRAALLLNLDALADQAMQLESAGGPVPAEPPIAIPMTPDWMHQVRAVRA